MARREEAAAFALLTAEQAELAGLCPSWLWEDEALPVLTRKERGEDGNVVEVVVRAASVKLGVRSVLAARGAAAPSAEAAPAPAGTAYVASAHPSAG